METIISGLQERKCSKIGSEIHEILDEIVSGTSLEELVPIPGYHKPRELNQKWSFQHWFALESRRRFYSLPTYAISMYFDNFKNYDLSLSETKHEFYISGIRWVLPPPLFQIGFETRGGVKLKNACEFPNGLRNKGGVKLKRGDSANSTDGVAMAYGAPAPWRAGSSTKLVSETISSRIS